MSHSRPLPGSARRFAASTITAFGRYRRFLHDRDASLLLGAGVLSAIGDWFNTVALIALAFNFGEGVLGVGGLLILRMLPRLILQGPAGILVDKRPGRGLLISIELIMAVIAASFALLYFVPSLWLAYALVVALESANTIARPGFMVRLLAVVEPTQRPVANGLYAMGITIAQFAGPLLGGLMLALIGTTPLFLVNGLTFVLIAAVVAKVRVGRLDPTSSPSSSEHVAPLPAGSYRELFRRADVLGYIGLTVPTAALIQATIAFFIVRAHDFGLGDGGTGPFFAAAAVGFFIGGAIAGAGIYQSPRALILVAAAEAVGLLALVGFGLAGAYAMALLALVISGIAAEISEVPAISDFQHRLPERIFGRFYSLFTLSTAGGGLVGLLIGPLLGPRVGIPATLALIALPGVLAASVLIILATRIDPEPRVTTTTRGPDDDRAGRVIA